MPTAPAARAVERAGTTLWETPFWKPMNPGMPMIDPDIMKIQQRPAGGSIARSGGGTLRAGGPPTAAGNAAQSGPSQPGKPSWKLLGEISEDTPTVSDMLVKHPEYGKDTWRIIFSRLNRDKPYRTMPVGVKVYIHSGTREIAWRGLPEEAVAVKPGTGHENRQAASEAARGLSEGLVQNARDLKGTPYERLDCFDLVVGALQRMGMDYSGSSGLHADLVQAAVRDGKPENRYVNGEGLVKFLGNRIFEKQVPPARDPEASARLVLGEMLPRLKEGQILSFSTRTSGHTGVVSRMNDEWGFINSGTIDNALDGGDVSRGVGEERLSSEIRNWVRRAGEKGESLLVTLGDLSSLKMARYRNTPSGTFKVKA